LKGAETIVTTFYPLSGFDAFFVLDCGSLERLGGISSHLSRVKPLINIDHHINNTQFGDVNLVEPHCSSVGEMIYRLIESADLPMNSNIAENIFVAIQTDTGSFKYDNTTRDALTIAGEMLNWGVEPWKVSRKVMDGYSLQKLKLLESSLSTIELHHGGKVGLMMITRRIMSEAGAGNLDTEKLVDYVRFIYGVEIGVLLREIEKDSYRFSLRSNNWVNVSDLAGHFGGGGHTRAAAFTRGGNLGSVKQEFLDKAREFFVDVSS